MSEFKSFYKTVGGNEGDKCHYPTRLDTYGTGCQHDCSYCYAKSLLKFRNLWNSDTPAIADIEKVRKKIWKLESGSVVRLGGMTDCFQPLELKEHVTYNTIKALNMQGVGYLIVTKSDIVARDEYMSILNKRLAHIQISVTCTDDTTCRTFEKAVAPSLRIAAIEKLYDAGLDVSIRLSPYIPQFIDCDVINGIRCDKLLVEFLRVNSWIRKWFNIDFSDYSLKESNYNHLPLEKKLKYLSRLKKEEMTVCDDVTEHYEYFRDHFNTNPNDCCNLRV